uniref:Uncharacterized protein n=1 Tax=Manihot esculenta TaxID=3983 RepID=A0A2C9W5W1_MANES
MYEFYSSAWLTSTHIHPSICIKTHEHMFRDGVLSVSELDSFFFLSEFSILVRSVPQ